MSVSDEEISAVGGSGGGVSGNGGDDGDDEEDKSCGGVQERDEQKKKKRAKGYGYNGFSRNFGKAKNLVLHPLTRAKRKLSRKTHIKGAAAPNVSSSSGKGCCFCFTKPLTGESSIKSQTSDPNDPNFTYDMLKVFIEKNDFSSKECNPHLDSQVSCSRD